MPIEFEIKLPDEPFKNSFILDKTAKLTYEGPRYLIISVFKDTDIVSTYEDSFDTLDEINLENYVDDDTVFYIIDAQKHPLEACFITHMYKNEEVDNYEVVLPTGETWVYPYENHILGNVYTNKMPTYNSLTDEFSPLTYLTPAIPKEDFFKNVETKIKELESTIPDAAITSVTAASEEYAKYHEELKKYVEWLKNIKTTYYEVDHWKIPFISEPNM